MSIISSPQNERVKLVRLLLRQSKTRRQTQRLVLEGVRLVRDAVLAGVKPDFVCYTPGDTPAADLIPQLSEAGITCLAVAGELMRDMTDTETPQGVVGVFPWPDLPVPAQPDLIVVADGWRDPGNLGTLLRTAAAAGVSGVVLTPGTVDPTNPKTLRAGMGAHFRVPVLSLSWSEIHERFARMPLYLADAAGEIAYDAVNWRQPSIVVIGGEAHGPQDAARDLPHTLVRIPMVSGAESLNAAVAASLLIYEARRHTWG
ncbi:MAG: RNA methyltransferase [Chloroflexi bacterium]|nr:RNA methyltransferase [Chloroflexota bacterium]